MPNQGVPACVGNAQSVTLSGLQACTWYYFAIRTVDESGNYSPIAFAYDRVKTLCGGGGGGFTAREAREDEAGADSPASTPSALALTRLQALAAAVGAGQGPLIAEYQHSGGQTSWTLHRAASGGEGDEAASADGQIVVSGHDGGENWRAVTALPELPLQLGVLAPGERGRVALPGLYDVGAVGARRGSPWRVRCTHGSDHSRSIALATRRT